MNTKGHRYFLYARKSSESEDRQMASIPDQVKEVKRIASELKLNIVDVITESRSAKAPGRPYFNEMLLRIQRGEADGILCWKLNRLARNPVDGGEISWLLQQGLIQHIQCFGRDYKPSDNVLMMQVEFGMANQYVKELSVDVKRGMRLKAERGWYPSRSLPIGYKHNKLSRGVTLKVEIIGDEKFDVVKQLWSLMVNSKFSISEIKQQGDQLGLRNARGKLLSLKDYRRIFNSKFYAGYFNWKNASGIETEFRGKHEAMVSLKDYTKVQSRISGNISYTRKRELEFLFRGILKCGECGCSITAERKRHARCNTCKRKFSCLHSETCPRCKNPPRRKIFECVYYRCTKKRGKCSQPYIKEKDLTACYREAIKSISVPEEFYDWAVTLLEEHSKRAKDPGREKLETLKHQYAKLESRLKNLTLMRADGEIGSEEMKLVKGEIIDQLQDKDRLIQEIENQNVDWEEHHEAYAKLVTEALEIFEKGDIQEVQHMLKYLGSNHILMDGKLHFIRARQLLTIQRGYQALTSKKGRLEP